MATDLERLVVSLDADIKKFDNSLKRAVSTFTGETRKIEARAKLMQKNVNSSFADLGKGLALGGAAAGLTAGIMAFKELADGATRTQNALKVAGLSGSELTSVYEKLFKAAQDNAAPIEDLVKLYSRVAINQKELGVSSGRLVTFSENVAKALRVQGTSAQEARGALLQLSQALGSGTVRAEEFNSILEGVPTILQAVAAGISSTGGSVAKLRQLMLDGKLSSTEFFAAFERGAPILDQKLKGSVLTIGQAMTQFNNSLQNTVAKFDAVTGSSQKIVEVISTLSKTIDDLGRIFSRVANSDAGAFIAKLSEMSGYIDKLIPGIDGLKNLPANIGVVADALDVDEATRNLEALQKVADDLSSELDTLTLSGLLSPAQAKIVNTLIDGLQDGSVGADEVTDALDRMGTKLNTFKQMIQPLIDKWHELKEVQLDALEIPVNAVDARPGSGVRDTSIYSDTLKRNEFFNQRDAEAAKSELEKNVDTRAKAIIDAANKVGIVLNEAAAKIQARAELAAEATSKSNTAAVSSASELIKKFEDFRETPYWDVNAYRVGYGSDTVTLADGSVQKVVQGMKVSVSDANRDLERRLGEFQDTIRGQIGSGTFASMNESQQAALTSIAYNYGSLPSSVVSAIKAGSTEGVYDAIRGLRTDNGGINAGRRDQEAQIYLNGAPTATTDAIKGKESFAEKLAEQQRMLEQLKEETGIRASLNPLVNDYGLKLTTLQKAQELLNLAQQEGTAAGKELTSATQLLNGDLTKLTPAAQQQAEAMRTLATQYGQTSAAAEQLKASQEAAAKSSTESLELAKSVTGGILSDIRSALSDGKITWKEWGEIAVNALNKVADKLQEMLLNQLFSPTSGLGGIFGGLFGGTTSPVPTGVGLFGDGGYTGPGGKNEPAGIVHKGEYVFDAESVRNIGVRNLEALRGYANGGLVGHTPDWRTVGRQYGPREDIHVVVDDEGSLRAYVQGEGRRTEARVATRTQTTFDNYRSNDLRNDIDSYTSNPRRRGAR